MWAERNERGIEGEPPCDECRVELMPENKEAHQVFWMVRHQLIMGSASVVDIRHDAIWRIIDELKIRKRWECFEKVCALAREWWIPKLNEKKD